MQKIDFVNSQQPAINDTNLNQMQLNIENAINAQVAGDTLPVGSIVPYGSDVIPENWLLCDGSAISRTEYALLFSIIGTTYGVGDGSTTFNLPNLKGRVAVGKDSTQTEFDTLGETGGEKTHTLTVNEMPSHNHNLGLSAGGSESRYGLNYSSSNSWRYYDGYDISGETGGGQAHNILQPYQVTNYIIKATQSAGIVATVVNNLTSTSATDALSAKQGKILGSYSTSETVVGTWINKPLYRKVVDLGALPNGTVSAVKSVPHGLTNFKLVRAEGVASRNDNEIHYPLPFPWHSSDQIEFLINATDVVIYTTEDKSNFTGYIILEYTKTTD